jgi:hypothetical protein
MDSKQIHNTLRLTKEFDAKFFEQFGKHLTITPLSIILDDIKNYRPLTDIQLKEVVTLSEEEKIKVIEVLNMMFLSLCQLL